MNSCAYYQELISSLVDGELSDEENEALMLHLNTCSRCNAMYAVFHDLSDILSEDPEPLPEGLHENIMAGVRRSEIMKKNRRMRRIGLRTAMTAAACAVLVLFAAVSFDPGRRADSVSIHSEQEAMELLPIPSPVTGTPDPMAAPPVQTAAPMPTPMKTPVPAYGTDNGAPAYTTVQPEQYNPYFYDSYQETAPLPAWTPAAVWTPAPETYTPPAWTPAPATPAPVWTPAPAAAPAWTPAPASTAAPAPAATAPTVTAPAATNVAVYEMSEQAAFNAAPTEGAPIEETSVEAAPVEAASVEEAPAALTAENTVLQARAADPAPAQDPEDAADYGDDDTEPDDEPVTFSLFSGMMNMFAATPPDQLADSKLAAPAGIETSLDTAVSDDGRESPAPVLSGIPLEIVQEEATKPATEEHVTVYGNDARAKLLAMIGKNEDTLPQEAELTRLVHVALLPDDAYGTEEKMDIAIYGDFVYCSLYPVEGGSVTYRADCSLRELDSFLETCPSAPAASAAPTPDPYIDPTPVPSPDESTTGTAPTE